MIAFHDPIAKHLIIVPYKCGTNTMTRNSGACGLNVIRLSNDYSNDLIKQVCAQAIKKTFITRDPMLRYFSFFNAFAYSPTHKSSIIPKKLTNNFYQDIYNSIPLLKKYHDTDPHTTKQRSFFDIFNENVDEYEFIDTAHFNKWFYLSFAQKITEYTPSLQKIPFPNTLYDFSILMDVKNEIKNIYEEDYAIYTRADHLL